MARHSSYRYYHGTDTQAAIQIRRSGFTIHREEWGKGLGYGVYLSTDPNFAAFFGEKILQCTLAPHTRLLWHDTPVPEIIRRLVRKFTRKILKPDFYKAIPENKRLTCQEVAALWRHLVHNYYETDNRKRYERFRKYLSRIHKEVKKCGYDGVGIRDDMWSEVLIFDPSVIVEVS